MDSIVACGLVQDAAPFILEWIAYHRIVGVDRFVLYDRGSTDGPAAVIARSRFSRQVTVVPCPRDADRASAYRDFVASHTSGFAWAALIDPGDFLQPLATDSVRSLLPRYDGFSTVMLRRLMFVLAGTHRPGQLLLGSHTNRAPDASPQHGASPTLFRIADIQDVQSSPTTVATTRGACDGSGRVIASADEAGDDVFVINCYRRIAERHETIPDRRIARFIPRLRALLHDAPPSAAGPAPVPIAARQAAASGPAPPNPTAVPIIASAPPEPSVPPVERPVSLASATAISPFPPAEPPTPTVIFSAAPAPAAAPLPRPGPTEGTQLRLGIGIITYNRPSVLAATLDRVQRHTGQPCVVAVADDGSTDETLHMLRARQILTVTGRNTGVAWNKNRALFLLLELQRCDVVILLEDDAYPSRDGWEEEWVAAARRWGHVNAATDWLREYFISGSGTLADPIISHRLTAQCAVFSREAILFGGYFDTRFRGYGHEHVEHTWRLLRMGYGGSNWSPDSKQAPQFKLLWGGIAHHRAASANEGADWQTERNRVLAQLLLGEYSYRPPYQNEEEARQLRDEMRDCLPPDVI